MKQLKDLTKKEYKSLDKIDMLEILYPEATGDYVNDVCNGLEPYEIKNELFERYGKPKFKVGDWVTWHQGAVERIVGVHRDLTMSLEGREGDHCNVKDYRLATPEEIKSHLIEEAKRRGYKHGSIINSLITLRTKHILDMTYSKGLYDGVRTDTFWYGGGLIYKQGKWAEIIKEEPIKIGGYEVEFFDKYFKIGCMSFSKSDIFKILTMNSFVLERGLSFTFNEDGDIEEHCNNIKFDENVLNKILEKFQN